MRLGPPLDESYDGDLCGARRALHLHGGVGYTHLCMGWNCIGVSTHRHVVSCENRTLSALFYSNLA